ncbi:MAG: cytochrome c-type biogenesis protein CcmH, partial [bacterium]|nr:cytochrome c-type biogenesis protein CcmH [bacterium]
MTVFAALLGASLAPGYGWGAVIDPKTTFEEVASAVMSPACPGKLLINCPSGEGAQLRELVRRKIAAGETKEQIVQYFVEVYGIEALPNPPPEGFYLTAWLLPFAGIVAGVGGFLVMVWSWSA